MKTIIVTLFSMVFMSTISLGQKTGQIPKKDLKNGSVKFEAKNGEKEELKELDVEHKAYESHKIQKVNTEQIKFNSTENIDRQKRIKGKMEENKKQPKK